MQVLFWDAESIVSFPIRMYTGVPYREHWALPVCLRIANDDRVRDFTLALLQFEKWGMPHAMNPIL